MKIIKEGKLPQKDAVYTGTCQNCGCEIEAGSHERIQNGCRLFGTYMMAMWD